jgi:hypothetical protein
MDRRARRLWGKREDERGSGDRKKNKQTNNPPKTKPKEDGREPNDGETTTVQHPNHHPQLLLTVSVEFVSLGSGLARFDLVLLGLLAADRALNSG